jgi:hypothetical protein
MFVRRPDFFCKEKKVFNIEPMEIICNVFIQTCDNMIAHSVKEVVTSRFWGFRKTGMNL